jgi:uncharacterized ParB-like nuclease family protein
VGVILKDGQLFRFGGSVPLQPTPVRGMPVKLNPGTNGAPIPVKPGTVLTDGSYYDAAGVHRNAAGGKVVSKATIAARGVTAHAEATQNARAVQKTNNVMGGTGLGLTADGSYYDEKGVHRDKNGNKIVSKTTLAARVATPVTAADGSYYDANGVHRDKNGNKIVSKTTLAKRPATPTTGGTTSGTTNTGGTTTTGGPTKITGTNINLPAGATDLGDGTYNDSTGVHRNSDGSRVVSGATQAARAQTVLIQNVIKYGGFFAAAVGSIYVIRRYKLLTGGK